jgi:putative Holliday junction resolvase
VHHKTEEFLGVDVGGSRVGIARGSSVARIAEPLKTVPAGEAIEQIAGHISRNQTDGLVIGLPRNLSGEETEQTKAIRQWVEQAKADIKLPFYWQDEALTSREAAVKVQASKFKSQIIDEHAVAASIILQDFLDTPQEQRVRC